MIGLCGVDLIYGYQALRNSYQAPPVFPRSKESQEYRMDKAVKWKRSKIRERRTIHFWTAAAVLFGTPLAIALLAFCWRLAIDALLS